MMILSSMMIQTLEDISMKLISLSWRVDLWALCHLELVSIFDLLIVLGELVWLMLSISEGLLELGYMEH